MEIRKSKVNRTLKRAKVTIKGEEKQLRNRANRKAISSGRVQSIRRITKSKVVLKSGKMIKMQDVFACIEASPLDRAQQKKWNAASNNKKSKLVKKMFVAKALIIQESSCRVKDINAMKTTDKPIEHDIPRAATVEATNTEDTSAESTKEARKAEAIKEAIKEAVSAEVRKAEGRKVEARTVENANVEAINPHKIKNASVGTPNVLDKIKTTVVVSVAAFDKMTAVIDADDKTEQIKKIAIGKAKKELYLKTAKTGGKAAQVAGGKVKDKLVMIAATLTKSIGQAVAAFAASLGLPIIVITLILAVIITVMIGIIGIASTQQRATAKVSAECEAYRPLVQKYATQYGVGEYTELILAVMMQESGGRLVDVMQSAEGAFNTRYPHVMNGITDTEYSIECGVQEVKFALNAAGATGPTDMPHIKLALQGYNFGSYYITWALARDGGYTQENAIAFSDMMCARPSWHYPNYGDKQYVPHVLQYYIVTSTGSSAMGNQVAQLALTKVGCRYSQAERFGEGVYDCSSLVFRLYKEVGIAYLWGMTAADEAQYMVSNGMSVTEETLEPGDIIFYGGGNNGRYMGIYHVAIYVGDGMQVDARGTNYGVVHRTLAKSNINVYCRPK